MIVYIGSYRSCHLISTLMKQVKVMLLSEPSFIMLPEQVSSKFILK